MRSSAIIHSKWVWDPLTRSRKEIRLGDFLYQGIIFHKRQPEVSKQVVSVSWVFTVSDYCPLPDQIAHPSTYISGKVSY